MQMFTMNRIRKKCKQNFFSYNFFSFLEVFLRRKSLYVWLKKYKIAEARSPEDKHCQVRSCRFLT